MKFALSKIKNYLQGIKSGVNEAENQINDLEHKEVKNNQAENTKKTTQRKDNPQKWGE